MISKTIGCNGVHDIFRQTFFGTVEYRGRSWNGGCNTRPGKRLHFANLNMVQSNFFEPINCAWWIFPLRSVADKTRPGESIQGMGFFRKIALGFPFLDTPLGSGNQTASARASCFLEPANTSVMLSVVPQ